MRRSMATVTCFCMLAGCASQPEDINPQYVSPAQYQSYNCRQIEGEMQRVSSRVRQVTGEQKSEADGDAVALGVGLVLFWPALFFMIGKDQEEELARLKGEYEALETASIQKDCAVTQEAGSEGTSYNPVTAYAASEDAETPSRSSPSTSDVANLGTEKANATKKTSLSEKAHTAETAYWKAIKDSNDPKDFEVYLATFPNGQFVGQAKSHLVQSNTPSDGELALWNSVKDSTDPAEYAVYLNAYPQGSFSKIAAIRQQKMQTAKDVEARWGKLAGEWSGTGYLSTSPTSCAKFYKMEAKISDGKISGRFYELGDFHGKTVNVDFSGEVDEGGTISVNEERIVFKGSINSREGTGEGTWSALGGGCRGHFEIAKT